ncbi:hypothetical protein AHAS_Ahas19G0215600 [Arachis hypogaea]
MKLKIIGKIGTNTGNGEEDEMLISAWLNVSTDSIVGTDQKGKIFWNQIHSYCIEFSNEMKRKGSLMREHLSYIFLVNLHVIC